MARRGKRDRLSSTLVRNGLDAISKDLGIVPQKHTTSVVRKWELASVVYTAFDGDDFNIVGLMARHVFECGRIAISPELCLGYKDVVDQFRTKWRVLIADISLLDKCDELWVYTRQAPDNIDWNAFPEGVLVELLWHCKSQELRGEVPKVSFVDVLTMLTSRRPEPVSIEIFYDQLASALDDRHVEVLHLVDEVYRLESLLPVASAAYAMKDAKNGMWLREWILRKEYVPVVPSIAFDPAVCGGLENLVAGWITARRIADIWYSFDATNNEKSLFLECLSRVPLGSDVKLGTGSWVSVGAPKEVLGDHWPITRAERDNYVRLSSDVSQSHVSGRSS